MFVKIYSHAPIKYFYIYKYFTGKKKLELGYKKCMTNINSKVGGGGGEWGAEW